MAKSAEAAESGKSEEGERPSTSTILKRNETVKNSKRTDNPFRELERLNATGGNDPAR